MSLIPVDQHPNNILRHALPDGKDHASRVAQYIQWLNKTGKGWKEAPLSEYATYLATRLETNGKGKTLLTPLSPASINAHLSTIRKQYRRLLGSNELRAELRGIVHQELLDRGIEDNPANVKAVLDEIMETIEREINPDNTDVKEQTIQDRPDNDHIRLTFEQSLTLLSKIDTGTNRGLRDYTLVALMLSTGIREAEAAALTVGDLRHKVGGEWCLLVRNGKGSKQRAIPYGANIEVLAIVDDWLNLVNDSNPDAPIFRAVNKGDNIQSEALTTRTIQRILDTEKYQIVIEGVLRSIKPHDLRRSYAWQCWSIGMDLVAIQQNLGHADLKTTLGYIGNLDTSRRAPKTTGLKFNRPKRLIA